MLDKVSIIIPIYKVEKYIKGCIESAINQSYKNLEIILVDDGSPDNCGKIIDEYALIDNRIITVHKSNGGLSDARNYGMKYVTGDYTLFLDSDDWIKRDMVEVLLNLIKRYNADIVQSAFYYQFSTYLLYDDRYYSEDEDAVILNNHQLMGELVKNERVKNFVWGKLYRSELVKNIKFEKGKLFEDVFWAHQVMHKVNKYVIYHKPLYYYLQRKNSIVSDYNIKNLDIIEGLNVRHKFIKENYPQFIKDSYQIICKTNINCYNLLLKNKKSDLEKVNRRNIEKYIHDNFNNLYESVNFKMKVQLVIFKIYAPLNLIVDLFYRIISRVNIFNPTRKLKKIKISK